MRWFSSFSWSIRIRFPEQLWRNFRWEKYWLSRPIISIKGKIPQKSYMWTSEYKQFRNKFMEIEYILTQNLMDVLFASETKIDSSFTNAQFHINDFKLHRSDRNCHGGGILAYVRSDLSNRRRCDLEDLVCNPNESLLLEMYINHYLNQSWLIIGEVPWHSSQGIILRRCEDTNQ